MNPNFSVLLLRSRIPVCTLCRGICMHIKPPQGREKSKSWITKFTSVPTSARSSEKEGHPLCNSKSGTGSIHWIPISANMHRGYILLFSSAAQVNGWSVSHHTYGLPIWLVAFCFIMDLFPLFLGSHPIHLILVSRGDGYLNEQSEEESFGQALWIGLRFWVCVFVWTALLSHKKIWKYSYSFLPVAEISNLSIKEKSPE